jgi:hypothetical protein
VRVDFSRSSPSRPRRKTHQRASYWVALRGSDEIL